MEATVEDMVTLLDHLRGGRSVVVTGEAVESDWLLASFSLTPPNGNDQNDCLGYPLTLLSGTALS